MSYIEDCLKLYEDEFRSGNWNPENDQAMKEVFEKANSIDERCFELLVKSVFSGEYITFSNIDEYLQGFIDMAMEEYSPDAPKPGDDYLAKVFSARASFTGALVDALKSYRYFISTTKDKFINFNRPFRYGFITYTKQNQQTCLADFNHFAIKLCSFDYRLPVNERELEDLLLVRADIKERKNKCSVRIRPVYSLLLQKSNFVIRRVTGAPFDWEEDLHVERIVPANLEVGAFDEMLKTTDLVNEEDAAKAVGSGVARKLDYVGLMRHLKASSNKPDGLNRMDDVVNSFAAEYQRAVGSIQFHDAGSFKGAFDEFSLKTVLNYLHNCRFSFYTQKCSPDLSGIKQELDKIKDVQALTQIRNYHPYEKAIDAILRIVEDDYAKNKVEDSCAGEAFDELEDLLKKYEECVEWGKVHKFFPFQLPFDESITHDGDYDLNLFVPSAYTKHIDYRMISKKVQTYRNRINDWKLKYDLFRERLEVERLKESIKNTDKKAYDIVALFTACLTFLFGVVNVFTSANTESLSQLITKTSGLGMMLILFMSLYLLVSPWLIQRLTWGYLKSFRFWIGIVVLLAYIVAVLCLSSRVGIA